nr:FxsB family cyclophane-forming radical SAM/SPASM peptide maturase [Asanoa ishikariensis]
MRRGGWQPQPFNEFILKVHSRCNLSCDYCYIYEMADDGWRGQPQVMQKPVVIAACKRIEEHVRQFGVPSVAIVLHGGEPLLAGHEVIDGLLRQVSMTVATACRTKIGMQTNGLLLDERYLRIFDEWDVRVGISVDGGREANDRHRRFRNGSGSFDQVASKIALLTSGDRRRLFSGLLCTIDLANDPVGTYESLIEFDPPGVDFLLPHGNWSAPPPSRSPDSESTPYGDWLIAVFDRWYNAPRLETRVRLFRDIIQLIIGGNPTSESVGLSPIRLAVIQTDGTLEQVDTLKSVFADAARIDGLAKDSPLAHALWNPSIIARQIGVDGLSKTCQECPVRTVCGGGNYTHRYRRDTGFINPSVYCRDLLKLITHIRTAVTRDIGRLGGGG